MTSVVWSGISNQSENVWIFPLQSFYCCTTGHFVVSAITTVNQKVHTWIRFLITFLLSSIHRTFEHYECVFFGTKLIPSCLMTQVFIVFRNRFYLFYILIFLIKHILLCFPSLKYFQSPLTSYPPSFSISLSKNKHQKKIN